MIDQLAYKNITISGLPGAGSTTLLVRLKKELEIEGWRGFSGGEFMRAYAEEKGLFKKGSNFHHSATDYEADFDKKVDYGMREKVSDQQRWIIESWLSGFMAQNVPGVLKVLMMCSSKAVRVDRIVNRDSLTTSEALEHIDQRYKDNLVKWQRVYAKEWRDWVVGQHDIKASDPIDFWRAELYDMVIDTYSINQPEAVELVLHRLLAK
ncbi:MAG: AAA family ATPase [Patescibacteria group bacterium]|nr:AAA family ATPase [Patescibacteria group bacterium]